MTTNKNLTVEFLIVVCIAIVTLAVIWGKALNIGLPNTALIAMSIIGVGAIGFGSVNLIFFNNRNKDSIRLYQSVIAWGIFVLVAIPVFFLI